VIRGHRIARAGATILLTAALAATPGTAGADVAGPSIIDNGTVQVGINPEGHLNVYEGSTPSSGGTFPTGLRYLPTNAESTAPGCLCEGWGVGDEVSGVAGFANVSVDGVNNLAVESFDVTASTAVSTVRVGDTFRVTHDYHPSTTPNLYEVVVSISNISADATDVRYRRVMDWDVEPTAFSEFVTMDPGNASDLVFTSNDGFASANPLSGERDLGHTGKFTDAGPADHGALFDFDFGALAAGATLRFNTYYGGAGTEADALAALAAVGAEAYSFGQPSTDGGPENGTPNTFIFAFSGIGGTPLLCQEDGLGILAGTPAEGVASGTVHGTVEPAVTGLNPGLGETVHQLNCDVVVTVEDAVDGLISGGPPALPAAAKVPRGRFI
jgi:hypothetical protein